MKAMLKVFASSGSGAQAPGGRATNRNQNGINGRAENGQSLRRQGEEGMGTYLRRVGSSVVGATAKTRGTPAKVVQNPRGRNV